MKGIVFSFKRSVSRGNRIKSLSISDIKYFFRRYGLRVLLTGILLIGLIAGTLVAQSIDKNTLVSLDFLFTTNLDSRLAQDFIGTFCACFASDFIFIIFVFLLALAPWGLLLIPMMLLLKGFGTGVTAGYLFISEQLSGVGFYLLVLLPGTFLFCLALIPLASSALKLSRLMLKIIFDKFTENYSVFSVLKAFSSEFLFVLIVTFCASLLDTLLWILFAGGFEF